MEPWAMPDRVWSPYCGEAPGPADVLSRWNADPVLLTATVGAMAAYICLLLGGRLQVKRPMSVDVVSIFNVFTEFKGWQERPSPSCSMR